MSSKEKGNLSLKELVGYLRRYNDRGTLVNVKKGTLEKIESTINSLTATQRSKISIEGMTINDFMSTVKTEINSRRKVSQLDLDVDKKTMFTLGDIQVAKGKDLEELRDIRSRRKASGKQKHAGSIPNKFFDTLSDLLPGTNLKLQPTFKSTITKITDMLGDITAATTKALLTEKPVKIITSTARLDKIFQSDIKRAYSDWVKKNSKKILGVPYSSIVGISALSKKGKKIRAALLKEFHKQTGLRWK